MARAQLLMFWDYDAQWGADRSRLPGGPKSWGSLEASCTDRLLELHADAGVPACFAVVGSVALAGPSPYHAPEQVRRVHAAGHEIASHSHRHEWLPGLSRDQLLETLRASRAALEDCIGAEVRAFVPPFNQPFDYWRAGSISLAERREAGAGRIDLSTLCGALVESGYRFCRVAYRPWWQRAAEWWRGRRLDRPATVERIGGVTCVRLNTPGGFDAAALDMVDACAAEGGLIVAYGHPHSLHAGNSQDERHLVPFLERVRAHRRAGRLDVVLPREIIAAREGVPDRQIVVA
ncbi:MAG: polysaccharide deacetylase family protein [Acidobacteria bacterium]|nr:polysaccharide deacetylase family protein [Acidobacteriota bacterium]